MKHLLYFVVMGGTMMALSSNLPGFHVSGWQAALLAAVVLAVVNTIIKPILFVLTLPFTILTLGLFLLVLNFAMLKLTDLIVPGFDVTTLPALAIGSLILSVVGMVWKVVTKDAKRKDKD
jgi:putative membrane protein